MTMSEMSRREFVALAAGAAAASLPRPITGAALTAQDVVDRIKKNVGVEWKAETVDTFKAGDPTVAVKGIVTTALATLDVLGKAVKAGANLVITCEPTFYSRADSATPPPRRGADPTPATAADPVFARKAEYILRHQLVVWRFNEHWKMRRPDPFARGLANALDWSRLVKNEDASRLAVPELTLAALASHVSARLNLRGGIRIVGDRATRVRQIGFLAGSTPLQAALRTLPEVDAIVAGEVREWETVEYARDAVTANQPKGLILVGRVVSEDPGMNVCAQWLGTIVPEVRTTFIAAGDPYWRPR
jgi:putative NIF3 family GTP cyclohydrolase 1 type 2